MIVNIDEILSKYYRGVVNLTDSDVAEMKQSESAFYELPGDYFSQSNKKSRSITRILYIMYRKLFCYE